MNLNNLKAYEIIEEREISDVKSMGYILRHKKSGARIAVLSNDDENKVFYNHYHAKLLRYSRILLKIQCELLCHLKKNIH